MGLKKLKKYIQSRDLTIHELSELSLIPESSLNKIIGGFNPNPNYKTIIKIIKALNLNINEILDVLELEIDTEINDELNNITTKLLIISESEKDLIETILDFFIRNRNK